MKNRFGIDIDGTVTRPDTFVPYLNKAFQLDLKYEDITQYSLNPFVNVSEKEFAEWFKENEPLIYRDSQLADNAKETLLEWSEHTELFFISARHSKLVQVTEEWFSRHELKYHHIELIGSHDKVATAKKYGVDLFFEDKHDNAVAIAEECRIPVILFNTPYNQEPVPSSVIRVDDWKEARKWVNNWFQQS
ncbi:5' nucleotidase, NT5C type [Peribacillus sp. SCS-155]|uniref:5' nucleotidase, NT5C type n=1 Tax=Peribacillus sedimenti TaxID=3115297 RepID=UPI0039062E62